MTVDLTIIWMIQAIFIHWACDFILQPGDRQSDNERKYIAKHCQSYAASFSLLSLVLWIAIGNIGANLEHFAAYLLTCILSHSIIDFILIPVLYKYKNNLKLLGIFWSLDQIIHISFIVSALYYFLLDR